MIAKKYKTQHNSKNVVPRGFLPDFSKYLFKDFPIENTYNSKPLIDKLQRLISALLTTINPAQDLQNNGLCKKIELMRPSTDKKFISKANFVEGNIYYAAYGNNPYRIIFRIDSSSRIAYFLALDTKHQIRKV